MATAFRKDFSTAVGIGLTFVIIGAAIAYSGDSLGSYWDLPSVLIVLGGTLCVTLASYSFGEVFGMPQVVFHHVFRRSQNPKEMAKEMLWLADEARKKSLLGIQAEVKSHESNRFLYKGLSMVVDGVEVADVERVMRQDMYASSERHLQSASILRKMAEVSPAMGLIGTLIGLVQMLGSLDDPSKIGPAMALALLTTFYGALLAYGIFGPLAAKLERNSAEEMLVKSLFLRSVVSIGKQENPRRLEILLNTILPPVSRVQYFK